MEILKPSRAKTKSSFKPGKVVYRNIAQEILKEADQEILNSINVLASEADSLHEIS